MKRKMYCLMLLGIFMLFINIIVIKHMNDERTEAVIATTQQEGGAEKKIAITFDDDVIIGLSQEISYKEAVSMI